MNVYLVQFQQTDKFLFEPRLKQIGEWVKYFDDNYLIASDQTPKEIYDYITKGYDNKSIFIVQINTSSYYGRMNTKVWDILKKFKNK